MIKLVLLRHGESKWNKENKFTGWTDIDLSEKGIKEAHEAGKVLKKEGYSFDLAYTSTLIRATRTLKIVLKEMKQEKIEVRQSWRLNEKHYGALQGLNKSEMAAKYGEEQVKIWRRSYDTQPPALKKSDINYNDKIYKGITKKEIPLTECLKDVVARFLPYWNEEIAPALKKGNKVLISGHHNSLRALVKYLDNISDKEILELNIPTGIPLVYELDDKLRPIKHYYLGNPNVVKAAMEKVKNQGKVKK